MKNKILLIISVLLWGAIAWRVASFNSAQLGPVQITWKNLQSPQTLFAWSPKTANYSFADQSLVLQPNQTATFLIRPPARFKGGTIYAPHSSAVINPRGLTGHPIEGITEFVWKNLARTPSGYPFTVHNEGQQIVTVREITLRLIP